MIGKHLLFTHVNCIVLSDTHLKGLNMGNKCKHARRASRQVQKSNPYIHEHYHLSSFTNRYTFPSEAHNEAKQ
ncbi:hypothetical protein DM972_28435 [Escherichia coli]|nr:hypothetical protein [Escherichia coli]EGE0491077.1 hypothetical protein [Escherichia coli]EGE0492881.1 hypothetical protein [Escherichia coli]